MQTLNRPPCFIIEGNIGAGKSTLVGLIENELPVKVVFEPHAQWQAVGGTENLLERFYKETERWAYTFQTYAFVTRVREQEKYAKEYPHFPQVLERSVYSDRYCFAKNCFESGSMNNLEWQLYQEWFSWLVDAYTPVPDGFIYLEADPEVCYKRLLKRDRHEEAGVPLSYLESLHAKHTQWLVEKQGISPRLAQVPVLRLNGNVDFEHNASERTKILHALRAFISNAQLEHEPVHKPTSTAL